MNISYKEPVITENLFISYIQEEESREEAFDTASKMGFHKWKSESGEITPAKRTKITLHFTKETPIQEFLDQKHE